MGGIKNKLSKLSDKAKTLFNSLPLAGRADEMTKSSQSREGNNNKGSRLPSFSQPSKMPDGQINDTRKLSHLGLYASKTIGSLRPTSQSLPLAKGRQMSVAHRWGRIAKYTSLACLTLAILSTITLNLISTYSSSNTNSNAEPISNSDANVSTLADNEASTNALDPTSISISISSYPSSSSTGGNDPNLSLSIPQGGGIATGRHTVTVSTGSSVIGYELQLSSNSDETGLVNNDAGDNEGSTSSEGNSSSNPTIPTTTGTITNPSQLVDKTYGYTLTDLSNNGAYSDGPDSTDNTNNTYSDNPAVDTNIWLGLQPKSNPATIATVDETDNILTIGQPNETAHNIYYGANIQNPLELRAGNYSREVVYTAIAELMPEPEVADLVLNSSWTDNTPDTAYGSTSILTGENLNSVTGIYIDLNNNEVKDNGEEVTNLTHATDSEINTKLTFTAPTYTEEGQKNVYLEWPGGDPVKIENGWSYVGSSRCNSISGMSSCRVDIDDNMVPVTYTGDEVNVEWTALIPCTYGFGLGSPASCSGSLKWFDYNNGQWANAVTLRDDYDSGCYVRQASSSRSYSHLKNSSQCNSTTNALTPLDFTKAILGQMDNAGLGDGEVYVDDERISGGWVIPQSDILGYWVYIPRYSYEVMRRDAIDLVQQPEDFKIKFETASDAKKVPVEGCSSQNSANDPKSYRVGCSLNRTYTNTPTDTSTNEVTGTTWATHPAFTWMDEDGNPVELNGIWVGKFETTGSTNEPTVLPNEYHLYNGNIGDYYDIAQSIGIEDPNNLYGNVESPSYNNGKGYHNLSTTTSHMLKNSEWGAVAYLSASKYGAGVNKVQINNGYGDGDTGKGPNSGEYNTANGQLASTTNNVYGIYDMAGGAYEYVMGNFTTDTSQSSTDYFSNAVKPPYVNLYPDSIFNSDNLTNNNKCTWATCGGHALHETKSVQLVSDYLQSWGDNYSNFINPSYTWFQRSGYAYNDIGAGLFNSDDNSGDTNDTYGFRVVLMTK